MNRKLQIKRGAKAALPALAAGELALTTDEKKLYYGTGAENIPVAMEAHSHTAADIGAAPGNHTHTAAQVGAAPASHISDASHATAAEKQSWNSKAAGNHSHTPADVGAAPASHTHPSASIGLVYGVCANSGRARSVNATGFILITGAIAIVKFSYGVPNNATLNINGTGAKPIRWHGKSIGDDGILAEDICELIYTGNSWDLLAIDRLAATGGTISVSFASDSWETIQKVCANGKHKSCYSVGDKKSVTLTTGEIFTVRIEDFDHDTLTSGGKAPLSLMMENCLKDKRNMNGSNTNVGGWGSSEMRTWISGTLFWQLPSDMQAAIKAVDKPTSAGNSNSAIVTTSDKLWLPSYTEVNFPPNTSNSPGGEGSAYPLFISDASRIKMSNGSAYAWWLRSPYANNATSFGDVTSNGSYDYTYSASYTYAVAAGFCI